MTEVKYTDQQRKALWKFCELLAESLNEAGLDIRKVLKPTYNIPWTKDSVHDHLFIPIQKTMFGTDSVTILTKQGQIKGIHNTIVREVGEKHGCENIPLTRYENYYDKAPLEKETKPIWRH